MPIPPAATAGGALEGVSCTSTSACTAVGGYSNSGGADTFTMAEAWNGTRWSLQSTPNPSTAQQSNLAAVSCVSAGPCMAVGRYIPSGADVTSVLAERWDGTRWSITPNPNGTGPGFELISVSCTSASACMAIGDGPSDGFALEAFSESWNGSSWSVQPMPVRSGTTFSRLFGVSCTAANACTAGGVYDTATTTGTFVERWDGTSWSFQPSPNPAGTGESTFPAVSCVATNACTAVGFYHLATSGIQRTLVERWSGTSWTIDPSPNAGPGGSFFYGVSCTALNACTAVGRKLDSANAQTTMAMRWNGTSWSVQSTPSPSFAQSILVSVSCVAPSWCQAVGFSQPDTQGAPEVPVALLYSASASPALSTSASAGVVVGGQVHDTATVSGGKAPIGSIAFALYGPDDTTCTRAPAFTSTVKISGDGSYSSASYTPTGAGSYRFTASYPGDANNNPAGSACAAAGEQVTVTKAIPGLSTTASGPVTIGGQVHDTAALSGGQAPSGTITFKLYGPGDATCSSAPVFRSTLPAAGNGGYSSASFTPASVGTYDFTAAYSGDQNNNPAVAVCGAAGEQVTVTKATVGLSTTASGPVTVGGQVHDTATLSAGHAPSGTITFKLYGPGDATCSSTPAFTTTVTVTGDGSYSSSAFTPTAPGLYRYTGAYSGDVNNDPGMSGCATVSDAATVTAPVRVAIKTSRARVGRSRLKLRLACSGGTPGSVCRGTLTLSTRRTRHHRHTTKLARARFLLTTGTSGTIVLRLAHTGALLLARAPHDRLRATATATLTNGTTAHRTLTLRRRPPPT